MSSERLLQVLARSPLEDNLLQMAEIKQVFWICTTDKLAQTQLVQLFRRVPNVSSTPRQAGKLILFKKNF